jgi:hypothetical protein
LQEVRVCVQSFFLGYLFYLRVSFQLVVNSAFFPGG